MVQIKDLQEAEKENTKTIDYELLRLLASMGDFARLLKEHKKRDTNKALLKIETSEKLAMLIIGIVRIANSLKLDLEKQFQIWYGQRLKNSNIKKLDAKQGYDLVSGFYDRIINAAIITEQPAFLRLVGNVKGKKLLDVGCGTGRYSILFAKKNAVVDCVDISKKMLDIAKQKAMKNKLDIRFKQGNLLDLPYKNNKFDIVISSLVLDHVKDIDKAIKELVRVCKHKGHIIISVMHPDIIKTDRAWFKSEKNIVLIKRYSKTVLDFVKAFNQNNCLLERILELKINRKTKNLDPYAFRIFKDENMILILKCKKLLIQNPNSRY